jgi:hypothetical protein
MAIKSNDTRPEVKTKPLYVEMTTRLHRDLRLTALRQGRSAASIVRELVSSYVASNR